MDHTTLISAQQLQALMASGQPLKVFDCSFDLRQPALGRQQFLEAHIPGALYASLDTDLSAHGGPSASGGRHPLPTREAFARWLTRVGMTNTTQAVVMDRNGVNYCGRLWWMLKWVGHENVAVLDGGLQAWVAAGGTVNQSDPSPAPATTAFQLAPSRYALVAPETVADHLGRASQTVLDARADDDRPCVLPDIRGALMGYTGTAREVSTASELSHCGIVLGGAFDSPHLRSVARETFRYRWILPAETPYIVYSRERPKIEVHPTRHASGAARRTTGDGRRQ